MIRKRQSRWWHIALAALIMASWMALPLAQDLAGQNAIHNALPPRVNGQISLVMVSLAGCPFCLKWEREVGQAYAASAYAQRAPLVRVRFGSSSLADFEPIKFTPTFLLLNGRREIGRIPGYPGRDGFWDELSLILDQPKPEKDRER